MRRIYLDYASLTPLDKGVMKVMKKYSKGDYTNPSSFYASGVAAKKALDEAKKRCAEIIHAHPDEILFTSGGTESNRLVLESAKNKKVIISAIEHSSIMKNVDTLLVPVNTAGVVDTEFLKNNLSSEVGLVTIMMVNNEIGVIEPISEIVKIVRDFNKKNNTNILVHADAAQAGYLQLFVEKLGIDFMTLDAHKLYGPRGVGMLYVKRGNSIERSGTENIPGIMGFTYALEYNEKIREKESPRLSDLKDFFIKELQKINPNIKVNGSLENSTPHILNVSIPNIDNEFFLFQLDAKGIEVSTKSACLRDLDESYVLKAIGASSKNSVRFSFGRGTGRGELKKVLHIIKKILVK